MVIIQEQICQIEIVIHSGWWVVSVFGGQMVERAAGDLIGIKGLPPLCAVSALELVRSHAPGFPYA